MGAAGLLTTWRAMAWFGAAAEHRWSWAVGRLTVTVCELSVSQFQSDFNGLRIALGCKTMFMSDLGGQSEWVDLERQAGL
jgi:hypothetical protein